MQAQAPAHTQCRRMSDRHACPRAQPRHARDASRKRLRLPLVAGTSGRHKCRIARLDECWEATHANLRRSPPTRVPWRKFGHPRRQVGRQRHSCAFPARQWHPRTVWACADARAPVYSRRALQALTQDTRVPGSPPPHPGAPARALPSPAPPRGGDALPRQATNCSWETLKKEISQRFTLLRRRSRTAILFCGSVCKSAILIAFADLFVRAAIAGLFLFCARSRPRLLL